MVKKNCSLFLLLPVVIACNCLNGDYDDKFTFTRTPYEGNALRFDGYYYIPFSDGNIEIYFLYRNGNLLYGTVTKNLQWLEKMFADGTYYNEYAKDDKTHWGIFRITGNKIEYERWVPATGLGTTAYRYTGTILNDTTFQMHSYCRVDGTDCGPFKEVFKFKRFSPKPDSVTKFIP